MFRPEIALTLCSLVIGPAMASVDGVCWNIRECKTYKGSLNTFDGLVIENCLRKCLSLNGCELVAHTNGSCQTNKDEVKLENVIEAEAGSFILVPKPCGSKDNVFIDCTGKKTEGMNVRKLIEKEPKPTEAPV